MIDSNFEGRNRGYRFEVKWRLPSMWESNRHWIEKKGQRGEIPRKDKQKIRRCRIRQLPAMDSLNAMLRMLIGRKTHGLLSFSFATILPKEPKNFGFPVGHRRGPFSGLPPLASRHCLWSELRQYLIVFEALTFILD